MRVLVISRSAWRNDNSTGNTLTDFFTDFEDAEFYSLCMREQPPQNEIAKRHFYISEKQLIQHLLNRHSKVGAENFAEAIVDNSEKKLYDFAKKHPSTLMMMAREMLWNVGGWKNNNLKEYIKEVNPDVVFFPVFGCYYPHKVLKYIHSLTNAKIVLFHADDNYTLKQFSLSPLYWIYRFGLRKWVRRSVRIADVQYCISVVQKADYDKMFGCECKLLTKFSDFSVDPNLKTDFGTPLQLVFTGNINTNRWKSLALLVETLKRINNDAIKAQLRIYTATPLTKAMTKALSVENTSFLMGTVPASKISQIQREADMLVHTEGLDLKSRLVVRQSFSTKIVDYLKAARPIVAIGPKNVASIKHLIDNDCAIVANNKEELYEKLSLIIDSTQQLHMYAMRAYLCGRSNHDKTKQKEMLQKVFYQLSNN